MYDVKEVKASAVGHWSSIASRLLGIDDDYLSTRHGPCPQCGGTKPWRVFDDFEESGGAVCNHCGKFGDGLALAQWRLGGSFLDALKQVAEFLGVPKQNRTTPGSKKREKQDPTKHLEWMPWNQQLAKLWCLKKKPITIEALEAVGAKLARYRKRFTVIAVPAFDSSGQAVAWTLYEIGGGKLPRFQKGSREPVEWLKLKVATGSDAGWMRYENDLEDRGTVGSTSSNLA